jgi:glycosyltransferase involved in cell wall biosynthesis
MTGVKSMFSEHPLRHDRIVICALETYSTIGGLQNFNQRVFKNVALRSVERAEPPALAFLSGDHDAGLPVIDGVQFVAPENQLQFLAATFWASLFKASVLLICHINLLPLAFAVRLFRRRLPIVLFIHGCEVWNAYGPRKRRFYEVWLVGALTRVASVSRFTAESMEREFHVAPDKFGLLPNAVDALEGEPVAAAPQPPTILTVARLGAGEREKNVHEMIAAVAILKERLPDVKYEIIGGGPLRPELEALAKKLGIADSVTFFGQVGDRELREAYGRAAVFAMPSNKEGFGIVYLEAWQFGKPVICSLHGAASEIIADGVDGFVVDPSDVKALADRLHILLTQPDLAKAMGERGRLKVEQKYLNANFRVHLDKILDEVLADSAAPKHAAARSSQLKL